MRYMHKMGKPDTNNPKRLANTGLSDLWFNHDHDYAVVEIRGVFVKYDENKMLTEAEQFVDMLRSAGLRNLPKPLEFVEDFFARL